MGWWGHPKIEIGDFSVAEITVPRDHQGEFEPYLVKKGQSHLSGLDEKIIALYARGMSVRDIQAQLQEMYGVDVVQYMRSVYYQITNA